MKAAWLVLGMQCASLGGQGAEPAPAAVPAQETARSLPRDSVGSLLETPADSAAAGALEGSSGAMGALLRLLGWVAAIGVAAVAAVRIWRKVAPRSILGLDGGGLKVVGRTALTPRHFIYAVRVGNQRLLVVGVSGDRISALSEFVDPAQVLALDRRFPEALSQAGPDDVPGGGGARGGGDKAASKGREEAEGLREESLLPYQREVRKLQDLVRNWRGRLRRSFEPRSESVVESAEESAPGRTAPGVEVASGTH